MELDVNRLDEAITATEAQSHAIDNGPVQTALQLLAAIGKVILDDIATHGVSTLFGDPEAATKIIIRREKE